MNDQEQANRRALGKWAKISGAILLLALAAVAVSAVLSVRQARSLRGADSKRIEIDRYSAQLQTVLVTIEDAETGQRGYLLTGEQSYLTPYLNAADSMAALLVGLQSRPVNDPALAADVTRIRELAKDKLSELAETIRLRAVGNTRGAVALVESGVGAQAMDQIRRKTLDALSILRQARDAIDGEVMHETVVGQRFELVTLSALLFCGLFAALQTSSQWITYARYERALGASERRYRAIVEDQTELIALSRADGALEFANPAYGSFFRIPADDLSGRSLYDTIPLNERKEWAERLALVLETNEALLREQFVPASEATGPRWIAWRHRAQHAADGIRLHSVGRDITLRKQAEEGLRAREDFLVRIGRVAGVGGWSMDLRSQKFFWSSEVRRIHEVSDDFVPELERALAFFPPVAREKLRLAVEDAIERHTLWDLELPFVSGTGRRIWVRTVGEAEFDSEGNATRLVGALQDVTDRKAIERSLRELTEVFDNTPDFVAQTDWQGNVHFLNSAARKALGMNTDTSLHGRVYSEFYTPTTNDRFVLEIIPVVKERGVWVGETEVVLEGGRVVPVSHMVIGHMDSVGRVSRYTSVMREITSEVANREELAKKTSTLHSIVEAIPAVLSVWDINARYQLVNRAFERWRGRGREHFLGRTIEEAVGPTEYARSLPWIERTLAGETVAYEKDYPDAVDQRYMSITYTPLRRKDGSVDGFIGIAHDITQHRNEQQRLVNLSETDPLTGLLNRAGFESYLIEKIKDGEGDRLAVLYIDLDHFKPVNDRHGHAAGDEVLRQFGARLKAAVRPTDAVARLGGDEFGVALRAVREPRHAITVADKIIDTAVIPFEVGDLQLRIGTSVGVAYDAGLEGGWKGLLARADAKVYEAKVAGRGRRMPADLGDSSATDSRRQSTR